MLSPSSVTELIKKQLYPEWQDERERLDRIDCWYRWTQEDVYLPRAATVELKRLVQLSKVPWLGLVVTSAAQAMYVDGYRTELDDDGDPTNSPPWQIWLANGMDRRQIAVHRYMLAYGYSFLTVLPGEDPLTGQSRSVMRGVSPRKMYAVYEDPAEDDWPQYALRIVERKGEETLARLYDSTAVHNLRIGADGEATYLGEPLIHDAGVCPVVRYANMLDLDGRTPGEVEPYIAIAQRINKTSYDRMLVQHFNSWKVRYVTGMAKPDDDEVANRQKLQLRQDDVLIAEDPDTKMGTLDETDMNGFIAAHQADVETLAAASQTPTHELTGRLANLPLCLDTIVPLPGGKRTTMGKVEIGDQVLDPNGDAVSVTALSPVYQDRQRYRLRFDDGNEVVADAEHLWTTTHFADPRNPYQKPRPVVCPECGYVPNGKFPARGVGIHRKMVHGVASDRRAEGGLRETSTVTTAEIAATLKTAVGTFNHFIPVAKPHDGPEVDYDIDPYVLGVWLGDGDHIHGAITQHKNDADELASHLRACGEVVRVRSYPESDKTHGDCRLLIISKDHDLCPFGHERPLGVNKSCRECGRIRDSYRYNGVRREWPERWNVSFATRLEALGVRRNKHIPEQYFQGSLKQRLALLQGIMDTDGSVNRTQGSAVITLHHERLAKDVHRLIQSVGHKVVLREQAWSKKGLNGRDPSGTCWRMSWSAIDPVFRLERKLALQRTEFGGGDGRSSSPHRRYIVACEPVDSVPVRCLTVDSDSHLFCVTDGHIATHNSADSLAAARASLNQKVTERQKNAGAAHAQALRLAASLEGHDEYATDVTGRVTWQDMEIRSMSQAADALVKLAALGIPFKHLWGRIPGVDKSDVAEWAKSAEDGDPIRRMQLELERQYASTPGGSGDIPLDAPDAPSVEPGVPR